MEKITHEAIKETLSRWMPSGHKLFPDGTELIGRVPHISEYAWFHELFAPPQEPNHDQLLYYIPNIFTFEVGKTLLRLNGMNLFSSHLFVYGLRNNYSRDAGVFQPWEITTHHREETHNLFGRNAIVFGGSDALPDGISFVENTDGTIEAFDRNEWHKPMHIWENFHDFIRAEIARLSLLFDNDGKPTDKRHLADFNFGR
jgi:hypothetical protein